MAIQKITDISISESYHNFKDSLKALVDKVYERNAKLIDRFGFGKKFLKEDIPTQVPKQNKQKNNEMQGMKKK